MRRETPMRRLRHLAPTGAVIIALLLAASATALEIGEPEPLPEVAFTTMDGAETDLDAFAGEVVVLNFWATWCAPCKREMPSLDRLQVMFEDRPVTVIGLAVDRAEPDKLRAWLDDVGVEHITILRDPELTSQGAFKLRGLPVTIVIDAEGREVARHEGFAFWDEPEFVDAIEEVVARVES